ncbi:MAG: hypothetical protein V1708_00715 [Candidatus Micrarchaeota archaeon]
MPEKLWEKIHEVRLKVFDTTPRPGLLSPIKYIPGEKMKEGFQMGAIGLASRLERSLTQQEIERAKKVLTKHLKTEGLNEWEDFEITEVGGLIPLTRQAAKNAPKREESVLLLKALNMYMTAKLIGICAIHERMKIAGN